MNEWQDITTAPNDGEHVLVVEDDFVAVAYQLDGIWRVASGRGDVVDPPPTYWMPLPDLPWRENVIEIAEEGSMRPEP